MKDSSEQCTEKVIRTQLQVSEVHYVYLVCCANNTLYVGSTKDVERRIAAHNAGRGGRYTRANRPVSLVCTWFFNNKTEALQAERFLKHLSPAQKLVFFETTALYTGGDS